MQMIRNDRAALRALYSNLEHGIAAGLSFPLCAIIVQVRTIAT
jgi:hypothetical protein